MSSRLHGVTYLKAEILIVKALTASNPARMRMFENMIPGIVEVTQTQP
jgi:hypothetical protein